jgi:hypothetical protein
MRILAPSGFPGTPGNRGVHRTNRCHMYQASMRWNLLYIRLLAMALFYGTLPLLTNMHTSYTSAFPPASSFPWSVKAIASLALASTIAHFTPPSLSHGSVSIAMVARHASIALSR